MVFSSHSESEEIIMKKFAKRLMTSAVTAVMAMSMVGSMSASAVSTSDVCLEEVTISFDNLADLMDLQTYYRGTYIDPQDSSSYLKFDGENVECVSVYSHLDETGRYITGKATKSQSAITVSGCNFTVKSGNYQYYYQGKWYNGIEDTTVEGTVTLKNYGYYQIVTITLYSKKYSDIVIQTLVQDTRNVS